MVDSHKPTAGHLGFALLLDGAGLLVESHCAELLFRTIVVRSFHSYRECLPSSLRCLLTGLLLRPVRRWLLDFLRRG